MALCTTIGMRFLQVCRVLHTFTLAVERKINQLGTYLEKLGDEEHVGEFQQRILVTHIDRLRMAVDKINKNHFQGLANSQYLFVKISWIGSWMCRID